MAGYYEDQWPAYVSVAERRAKAEREVGKLRKKGSVLSPVTVAGRKIVTTFWGKAWCDNLESYRDYANRLERGRSYARNGLVIDLQIAPHLVTAMVSGSSVYKVRITISEVPKAQWKSICADCAGGIDSLVELLQGRFSKGVMERICRQGTGLFPKPAEIKFSCSCLDHASMCKHVAGALYGVGVRLDEKPELLFRLRAVNENDLVADIGNVLPMSKQGPAADKVLRDNDMAALFGLDMANVNMADVSMGDPDVGAEEIGEATAPGVGMSKPQSAEVVVLSRRKKVQAGQAKASSGLKLVADTGTTAKKPSPVGARSPKTAPGRLEVASKLRKTKRMAKPSAVTGAPARPKTTRKVGPATA